MAYEKETIKLPSNGQLGYDSTLEIRSLTGADEKIIYSGANELAVDKLLSRCILSPQGFDTRKLCEQDKYFILMHIRMLTYGNAYKFKAECPECGRKVDVETDLSKLEVFYADDKFDDSMHITLPVSKDEIKLRLLTSADIDEVNRRLARMNSDRGAEYLLRCAAIIDEINGEKKTLAEKEAYLEDCSSRDINYIWNALGKVKIGVYLGVFMDCPGCGGHKEVPLVMNTEFFRPSFDE